MTGAEEPVLLNSYAAKLCPVRIHNDVSPVVPTLVEVPSEERQADAEAGKAFEVEMFTVLLGLHPTAVLVDPALRGDEAVAATMAAAQSGAPLILGGWLPDDAEGGRKGKPDILVKVDGGYLPADVKNHKTLKSAKRTSMTVSSLTQPEVLCDAQGFTTADKYYEDCLQLAHYTRMLQACGLHPGDDRLIGAILGKCSTTVSGPDPERVLVWYDLAAPKRQTFSRSRGKVRRSLLDCYDHEHDFRVRVAATARRITGSDDDPAPLVVPIGHNDCPGCPYEEWCAEEMGPGDASTVITRGQLSTREWRMLRRMGLGAVETFSELDPDDPVFFEEYYPEVSHLGRVDALSRLRRAVQQVRLYRDGIDLEPRMGVRVEVPSADVEIDFDIEWDADNRIYQWGLRVRDGQDDATAYYDPVVSFDPLDDDAERELAERAAARITELRAGAEKDGKTVAVYHWSPVERTRTNKFDCVTAALDEIAVDLLTWFSATFRVQGSAGIKSVAPRFGFEWAVDDPGGRLSMLKIGVARGDGPEAVEAQEWCLKYNESDCAAQAVIRDGVRARFPDE